jgi:hypothetical protein
MPTTSLRITTYLLLGLSVLALASLAAAADAPAGSAPQAAAADTPDGAGRAAKPQLIRLTPLTGRVETAFTNPDLRFSGAYTRLLILSRGTRDLKYHSADACDLAPGSEASAASGPTQASFLPYNDRGWLDRLFNSRHYAVNFTASMTIGDFQATVPLATLDHVSDAKEGEKFARLVNHSAQNFPLFLVRADGSNAIASLRSEVRASDQFTGSSTAIAVQAATNLVSVVAPASKVLTTLTAQKTKDAASGLDTALTALLQRSLTEDQVFENDIRRWGSAGVCLEFFLPRSESDFPATDADLQMVGRWKVVFEYPRPSIFADVQICNAPEAWCQATFEAAAREAQKAALRRPAQVLEFELLQGQKDVGTVIGYLQQQSWWTRSIQELAANASSDSQLAASTAAFCKSIKEAVAHLQLNEVDGGIVTAAVRDGTTLPGKVASVVRSESACASAVPEP